MTFLSVFIAVLLLAGVCLATAATMWLTVLGMARLELATVRARPPRRPRR
jgi:hypothetical protein